MKKEGKKLRILRKQTKLLYFPMIQLIDKLLHFSKEKTKSLEDAKDERAVYDGWSTR